MPKKIKKRKNPYEEDRFEELTYSLNPIRIEIEREFRRKGKPNLEGLEIIQREIFNAHARGMIDTYTAFNYIADSIAAFTKHGPVNGYGI